MKTYKDNLRSALLLRVTVLVAMGIVLVFSVAFGNDACADKQLSFDQQVEESIKLHKGVYLASVFNNFKKEKLKTGIYSENQLSEKVLLKVFVKYMKEQESK